MVLTNNTLSFLRVGGDDFTVVFPPLVPYFDKVVGVYPRFEGSFILRRYGLEGSNEKFFGKDDYVFVIAVPLVVVRVSRLGVRTSI